MPKAPRAYWSCGSVLEAHRRARTERFWLALIGADGKIWSAMKMLLKWNFVVLPSPPPISEYARDNTACHCFLPSGWPDPPSLNRNTTYDRGECKVLQSTSNWMFHRLPVWKSSTDSSFHLSLSTYYYSWNRWWADERILEFNLYLKMSSFIVVRCEWVEALVVGKLEDGFSAVYLQLLATCDESGLGVNIMLIQ